MTADVTPLADAAARERIAGDLDATLVVEAAAGTGKTSALVRRMVRVIMAGRARLDQVVAVTFTEAAAGELKLRLRAEIERERQAEHTGPKARARLTDSLPQLEEARIGTIHSFCSDLLRERPVEAQVDPLFQVAPDDVAGELFRRAFDRWFEKALQNPPEGVRRVLRRPTKDEEGPRGLLRTAALSLIERRDFPARWRPQPFDREAAIDAILDEMTTLAARARDGDPDDYFTRSLIALARFVDEARRREVGRPRDHDALESELIALARERHWDWEGYRSAPEGFPKAELKAARQALRARLDAFIDAAGADLAPRLRDELWSVVDDYDLLKKQAGCLDFLDLLLRARDLVRNDAGVRGELQRRYTHLFVDEFQDTDPLQAEILLLLAADDPAERDWKRVRPMPGKLFLVGDPKQSIYRFRRADVALYETVKRDLVAQGASVVHLQVSFRAVPEIQDAVNAAFAPRMQGQSASQATYVPLAPYRRSEPAQPALVALPIPAPYGDFGKAVNWKIEDSLPSATAAFIAWLVQESGWTVSERERPDQRRPIEPRDVCLLFRRFRSWGRDVTRLYVRGLEARQLPHVLVGGSSFHEREEVEAIRNALAAIERPDDDLSVFATLRGPLFALGDGALLAFRERFQTLHPFRRLTDDLPGPLAEVAAALAILRDLHRGRNRRPIPDTIARLLAATRAHAGLANWPTGEQALANVTRLMDLARRAERHGVTSFRRFVERLAEDAARGEASDAPIIEEGTGGVRIMTVHRAKGLEFPIVLLADLTANAAPNEPSRYTDPSRELCAMRLAGGAPAELLEHREDELEREREEAVRILYVAATRARDVLVVPVVGDERREGWLAALSPVLYPADARRRRPDTAHPPGCPAFGLDSVAVRPPKAPTRERSVAPGLHVPEAGSARVVWWDPTVLELDKPESVGLRQQRLLEADADGVVSERGVQAHEAWQRTRREVRVGAGTPSVHVLAATEWAAAHAATTPLEAVIDTRGEAASASGPGESGASAVLVESCHDGTPRPHGKRFGSLVHAVLATVPLDADRTAVEAVVTLHARLLGASTGEAAAAIDTALHALASPLMREAARAASGGRCRRETPIAVRLGSGELVEGVVDVAFADDDATLWTVVDFKTDVEIAGRLDEYRAQVALYADAVRQATGCRTRAVLLRV